jgi:hypothetical protein
MEYLFFTDEHHFKNQEIHFYSTKIKEGVYIWRNNTYIFVLKNCPGLTNYLNRSGKWAFWLDYEYSEHESTAFNVLLDYFWIDND